MDNNFNLKLYQYLKDFCAKNKTLVQSSLDEDFISKINALYKNYNPSLNDAISPFQYIDIITCYLNQFNIFYKTYYMDIFYNENAPSDKQYQIEGFYTFVIYKLQTEYYVIYGDLNNIKIYDGKASLEKTIRYIYQKLSLYFTNYYTELSPTMDLYLNEYEKLSLDQTIISQVKPTYLYQSSRDEQSSMAIVVYNDLVLTILTKQNKLSFPKGHIENNEDVITTAIRECYEETSVKITRKDFIFNLPSFEYSFNGFKFNYITNSAFYEKFKTSKINKKIYVNVFKIKEKQTPIITEQENFYKAEFIPINKFILNATAKKNNLANIHYYDEDIKNLKETAVLLGVNYV